jgi:EmrB/QacA subfamily drug resistance transporter
MENTPNPMPLDTAPLPLAPKAVVGVMVALIASIFMSAMDSTILSAVMPKVIREIGSPEQYSWPFVIYMICSTIVVPVGGRLADILGRKGILITGVVLFVAASVACGEAGSMTPFLVGRAFQGIGSGLLVSVSAVIVADIFPRPKVPKFQGLVSSFYGLAAVVGPFLGGALGDSRLGWRGAFYINVPLGLFALGLVLWRLPSSREGSPVRLGTGERIDFPGIGLLVATLVPFLAGMALVNKMFRWDSPEMMALMAVSAVMLVLFVLLELRVASPLVRLSLFRVSPFSTYVLLNFFMYGILYCGVVFTPVYLQEVLGVSAFRSGAIVTPMMLGIIIAANIAGRWIARSGHYKGLAAAGFVISLAAMAFLYLAGPETRGWHVVLCMGVLGAGLGVNMPVYTAAVQYLFPHSQMGSVTSTLQFFGSMGGTLSLVALGYVRVGHLTSRLSELFASTDLPSDALPWQKLQILEKIRESLGSSCAAADEACHKSLSLFQAAQSESLQRVFLMGAAFAAIALLLTLFHKEAGWSQGSRPEASERSS